MADVTGPISTLPGHTSASPAGMMCDDHPDRPAVKRIQGETDSFGSEQIDMCQECLDKYRAEVKALDTSGVCDWCNQAADRLRRQRDYDEGMAGPVYNVCGPCIRKANEDAITELEERDDPMFDDDEEIDW